MIKVLNTITQIAADVLVKVAAIGLALMTVVVGWQVFGRFVLNSSPSWSEQAALTLMIWYVSLAAAAGVREGFHIRIVAVENAASKTVRGAMRVLSNLIVGACGLAMFIWGGELVLRTWGHTIPSLGIPRGMAYGGLPIAGALIFLFSLERIFGGGEDKENVHEASEGDQQWS